MATERLSMRHIREVLRQKWVQKRSLREAASSLGISAGAVGSVLARATAAKLDWEQVEQRREEKLEERLYGATPKPAAQRPLPDPVYIHEPPRSGERPDPHPNTPVLLAPPEGPMSRFWHVVHNALAHPFLLVLPARWGIRFHDYTAKKAYPSLSTRTKTTAE
ncbi:hypothetical protein [Archangium violaceum]|uniref:HTH IS408-type domain-containing protein n=1 Tax=Archangium violaceum Cb vi76 TaxID=1406225 RepID=A0A084SLJ1_9BACT|nr:hypothetical protein [Archangium violaceum]KFA89326.1 hypothetical protein Q664_35555 [Archangium violaceum Cb vi76]